MRTRKNRAMAAPIHGEGDGEHAPEGRPRRWGMRLTLACGAPLLAVVLLEGMLRLTGCGYDPSFFTPGPQARTLVSNPDFARSFFGWQRSRAPMPLVFTPERQPDSYRIFVLGSSAALGDPDSSVGFARILEAMLVQRFPGVRFEVINTAMTAINSHVVRPMARECAAYRPDLFIVYMGNNEAIGPYGAGSGLWGIQPTLRMIHASVWLRRTRTGQLVNALAGRLRRAQSAAPLRWRGMETFLEQKTPWGDPRLERVYGHLSANLDDIAAAGRSAGAEVILCTLVTNLKDCPPFHSVHRAGLSADALSRWTAAEERGRQCAQSNDYRGALQEYAEATRIDDGFALLAYRMGQCHLALGESEAARRCFERARDLDAFRFRADTRMNAAIRSAAGRWTGRGVTLVDAEGGFASPAVSSNGIPGGECLYDHVHLNFHGNYAVASLLYPRVAARVAAGRGGGPGQEGPPTPDECARWLVYTKFNEFEAAKSMAARMGVPPFTPEQGRQAQGEMKRRLDDLTAPVIQQTLEQFRAVLPGRSDDLSLCANYANVLYVTGDNAGAVDQYRLLLARYPYASDWQYFLGDALAAQGLNGEAERWLRKAVGQEPSNAEAQAALGQVLVNAGRAREALGFLRRAVELNPDSGMVQYNLAMAYYQTGAVQEAWSHYQRAVTIAPALSRPPYTLGALLGAAGGEARQ